MKWWDRHIEPLIGWAVVLLALTIVVKLAKG